MLLSVSLVFCGLLLEILTNAQQLDPIRNFCSRFWHQSVVKNLTLYIDGGVEEFIDIDNNGVQTGPFTTGYNYYVIEVDLSTSWDWKQQVPQKAISKTNSSGTRPPTYVNGALYQGKSSERTLYLFGGTASYLNQSFAGSTPNAGSANYTLWLMDPATNSWSEKDVSRDNLTNRPSLGAWAEAPDLGLAFYYNGQIDGGSSNETAWMRNESATLHLPGMVVINTTAQIAHNYSTHASSGDFPIAGGGAAYIADVGPMGILVTMGGMAKPAGESDVSKNGNYTPLSVINVFDVNSIKYGSGDVWYRQNATGDVPAPRGEFCLVPYSTPDRSTHVIHLYGGRSVTGDNQTVFDDVYALSLPGFVWTNLFTNGEQARFGHTCHAAGGRQMITVGGVNRYAPSSQSYLQTGVAGCDWETKSVGVMDLSTAEWGSMFDHTANPYVLHPRISSATNQSRMKAPAAGFDTVGLASLMGVGLSAVAPWGQPSNRHNNRPAVIGGAVGGTLGGLLLIGSIIVLWMNRRRFWYEDRTNDSTPSNDNEEMEEQPNGGQAQQSVFPPPAPAQS